MRKNNLDKETRKVLTDQEKIKLLTEHEGWNIVRAKFLDECAKLLNIADINVTNPTMNLVSEIGMRQLAAAKILSIINDVIGTAQQYDMNKTLTEQVENGYVLRTDVVRR